MESPAEQEEFLTRGRFGEGPLSINRWRPPASLVRAYERRIFPHAASALWIPALLAIGWTPLLIIAFVTDSEGWTWLGFDIAIFNSFCAVLLIPVQAFRLLMYFINRPKAYPED